MSKLILYKYYTITSLINSLFYIQKHLLLLPESKLTLSLEWKVYGQIQIFQSFRSNSLRQISSVTKQEEFQWKLKVRGSTQVSFSGVVIYTGI